jgi:hypothetical protein
MIYLSILWAVHRRIAFEFSFQDHRARESDLDGLSLGEWTEAHDPRAAVSDRGLSISPTQARLRKV